MREEWETLQQSEVYTSWKKDHDTYFLAHIFQMVGEQFDDSWQFGFFNEEKEQMDTFNVKGTNVELQTHTEMAKHPETKIMPLDISKVTITKDEAEKKVIEVIEQEYNSIATQTKVYLLQHVPMIGDVWNMTMVTIDWRSINIKIDAATGEVKLKNVFSLMDMRQPGTSQSGDLV